MSVWLVFTDGSWSNSALWSPNLIPNSVGATASFVVLPGSGSSTADLNLGGVTRTVGHLDLASNEFGRYRLFNGTLVMDNGVSNSTIDVTETGNSLPLKSQIDAALTLNTHTVITVSLPGMEFDLKGAVSGAAAGPRRAAARSICSMRQTPTPRSP